MKIPRNKPCPCGSGTKYKKCCLNRFTFVRGKDGEIQKVDCKPELITSRPPRKEHATTRGRRPRNAGVLALTAMLGMTACSPRLLADIERELEQ